jgi:hypothetical protein
LARIAARSLRGGLAETILGLLSDKALGKGRGASRSASNPAQEVWAKAIAFSYESKIGGVKRHRAYIGCPETMYPDMVRDFLERTTVGKEGGTKMTNAHSIIWIKKCNFHSIPAFGEFNVPYRACVG